MGLYVNVYIRKTSLFVRLNGEMDQHSSDELRAKLSDLIIKYQIENVVFNLKEVFFMDSSGIGIILGRYNQVKMINGKVILCELNESIEKIVVLSGLPKICQLIKSEEQVINYLGVN